MIIIIDKPPFVPNTRKFDYTALDPAHRQRKPLFAEHSVGHPTSGKKTYKYKGLLNLPLYNREDFFPTPPYVPQFRTQVTGQELMNLFDAIDPDI